MNIILNGYNRFNYLLYILYAIFAILLIVYLLFRHKLSHMRQDLYTFLLTILFLFIIFVHLTKTCYMYKFNDMIFKKNISIRI